MYIVVDYNNTLQYNTIQSHSANNPEFFIHIMKFALTLLTLPLAVTSFGGIMPEQPVQHICEQIMTPTPDWGINTMQCNAGNCDVHHDGTNFICVSGYCRQWNFMPTDCVGELYNSCHFNDMNGFCENADTTCGKEGMDTCNSMKGEPYWCSWDDLHQFCGYVP